MHTLELVVWDVQNNKGSAEVDFIVAPSLDAAIGSVLAYPNPSATGFNFTIEHNIACSRCDVHFGSVFCLWCVGTPTRNSVAC